MNDEKAKPDIEYFYDIPYRMYCGKCGRLIATAGRYFTIDIIKERITACRFCGTAVDWSNDER